MGHVRPAAVAGTWYPATKAHLADAVDEHVRQAAPGPVGKVRALVAPHAGLMYSGAVAAFAYKAAIAAGERYNTVVLVGPSHFVRFDGVSVWPRGAWDTPLGRIEIDTELADAIAVESRDVTDYPAAHAREHSLELQMPFIARLLPAVRIVPLVMGDQSRDTAFALGDAIAGAVAGRSPGPGGATGVLLVASSDLSHYEDAGMAARMDAVVLNHLEALDAGGLMTALEREPRHACGGGAIVAVLRAAVSLGASRARILRYGDSGDVTGDKSSVVGYTAAGVW